MFSKLSIKNKIIVIVIFLVTIIFFSLVISFGVKNLFSSSLMNEQVEAKEAKKSENIPSKPDDNTSTEKSENNDDNEIKNQIKKSNKKADIKEVSSDPLVPTFHNVGTDMKSGIYKLECIDNDSSYYKITQTNDDGYEYIVEEELFSTFTYIEVENGQGLYVVDSSITPIKNAKKYPSQSAYKDGKYKIGFDLPEGNYKVTSIGEIGSVEISTSPKRKDTVFQQYISGEATINVTSGQYLKTSMISLKKM